MNTEKYDEYEQEYLALNDEAAPLVSQMKRTGDREARFSLRQALKPIDKRRSELDGLMDKLRSE